MARNLRNLKPSQLSSQQRAFLKAFPDSQLGKNWKRYKRDRQSDDIYDYIDNHANDVVGQYTTKKGTTYGWLPVHHGNIAESMGNAAKRAYDQDGLAVKVKFNPTTGEPEIDSEHYKK